MTNRAEQQPTPACRPPLPWRGFLNSILLSSKIPSSEGSAKRGVGSPHSVSGVTLVEVMLAIVILGIGAGTLLMATARCVSVATKSQYYSTAQRLVLRVNTEKPLTRGELKEGTESGSFDDGYTWEREVIENESEDRLGLYKVRTRVSWSERGKTAFEEVTTYVYVKPENDGTTPERNTTP